MLSYPHAAAGEARDRVFCVTDSVCGGGERGRMLPAMKGEIKGEI